MKIFDHLIEECHSIQACGKWFSFSNHLVYITSSLFLYHVTFSLLSIFSPVLLLKTHSTQNTCIHNNIVGFVRELGFRVQWAGEVAWRDTTRMVSQHGGFPHPLPHALGGLLLFCYLSLYHSYYLANILVSVLHKSKCVTIIEYIKKELDVRKWYVVYKRLKGLV